MQGHIKLLTRVETSSLTEIVTGTFSIEAVVRGYHVYQAGTQLLGNSYLAGASLGTVSTLHCSSGEIMCYCRSYAREDNECVLHVSATW